MDFDKVREAARGGARIDGVLSRKGARFLANEQGMTVMLGRGGNEEARERAGIAWQGKQQFSFSQAQCLAHTSMALYLSQIRDP